MVMVVEVSGRESLDGAEDLRGDLVRALGPDNVSGVAVERSAGDVAAWLSVGLGAIQAAGVVWTWWRARQESVPWVSVTVVLAGGERIEVSEVDLLELERRVRAAQPGSGGEGDPIA